MIVSPYGPSNSWLMAVGEAPGEEEERQGRPFVGPAGQKLREFFMQVGIDPEEVYYTNLCAARPPANKLEKFFLDGGEPDLPVFLGLEQLKSQILSVRPNVILALGNFALHALTGKGRWVDYMKDGERIRGFTGIQDWRGSILHSTLVEGFKVIPTYHPSYILREGMGDHGIWLSDLARAKAEGLFPEVRRPRKLIVQVGTQPSTLVNYEGVIDREEVPQWEPSILTRSDVRDILLSDPATPTTLDIEYIRNTLLCVGLTNDRNSAYVVPTKSLGDIQYVSDIIRNTKGFNAQNSMFDASILEWHYSLPIMKRVVFDTMVAAYVANVELPKGLDFLISIYTDQPYHKGMVNWKDVEKGKMPHHIVYAYNGIDVWTQHEIMEEQQRLEFDNPKVERSFRFLMALLNPLWEMSRRGIRIDTDLMKDSRKILEEDAMVHALELMCTAGLPDVINVKSGPQVSDLLFNKLGLKPLKMNKTGPATDDKTLAALEIKTKDPTAKRCISLIRKIRNARDLRSKFFDIEFDSDGRMRSHYDPTKTVTGRLASRKFYPTGKGANGQNYPRDKRARRAFIADRKKVFGYADLEKAESLVVAHLTGDPRMLLDHSPGQNAHRNLGAALFGKKPEELTEDEYYLSKKTRHAGNYMQGPQTFMRSVNQDAHKTGVSVDLKEAETYIHTYRNIHPGLPRWWDQVKNQLYKTRTLENLLGFQRIFYGHVGSILPEAIAFTPQSTVGQILNVGLLNLEGIPCPYTVERDLWYMRYAGIHEELLECGYEGLMQIHDAVAFQVYESHAKRAAALIREALLVPLTNPRTGEDFTIPVEVSLDLDPEHIREWKSNWGDCKVFKEF